MKSPAATFAVAAAADHGFLRVSKGDPHYFEFQDGTRYFAVGENRVHGSITQYDDCLGKLQANRSGSGSLRIPVPALEQDVAVLAVERPN